MIFYFYLCFNAPAEILTLNVREGVSVKARYKSFGVLNSPKPLLLIIGGFETGMNAVDVFKTDKNLIAASVDYPYKAPHKRDFVSSLLEIKKVSQALKDTDLAIQELIKYMQKKTDLILPDKVCVAGVSFGSPFALNAAVINNDIRCLIIAHGFANVDLVIEKQFDMAWKNKPLLHIFKKPLAKLAWYLLDYPNPEDMAQKIENRNILFLYPEDDDVAPNHAIGALNRSWNKNLKITSFQTKGGHITPWRPQVLNEIVTLSERWLKKQGFIR